MGQTADGQAFIQAILQCDEAKIDEYVDHFSALDLDFLLTADRAGNTLFHYFAAHGWDIPFYRLLYRFHLNDGSLLTLLMQLSNHHGMTPWHIAAQSGFAHFFEGPEESSYQFIFEIIKNEWLNACDLNGYTPLMYAMVYSKKDNRSKIKAKVNTVSTLAKSKELQVNKQSLHHLKPDKTALHFSVMFGCFDTTERLLSYFEIKKTETNHDNQQKIDLDIKDEDGQNVMDYVGFYGRKRIKRSIYDYQNPKFSSKSSKAERKLKTVEKTSLLNFANDINIFDKELLLDLKTIKDAHTAIFVINRYHEQLREYHRAECIRSALLSALCPAFTLATTAGFLCGFSSLAGLLVTGFFFPIAYALFTYACYQDNMKEYGHVRSEAFYLEWLAGQLPLYRHEVEKINNKVNQLQNKIEQCDGLLLLNQLKIKHQNLRKKHHELKERIDSVVTCSDGGKPKLTLQFLPKNRKEFKEIKKLGTHDSKANSAWITRSEKCRALFGYVANILCPAGAVAEVLVAILSALGIGFFSNPIGIAIFTAATIVLISGLLARLLYRSYQLNKAKMGEHNRELIQEYDRCKRHLKHIDFKKINQCDHQFNINNNFFMAKEQILNKVLKPLSLENPKVSKNEIAFNENDNKFKMG